MSCLTPEQIAIAAGQPALEVDGHVLEHIEACVVCDHELAEQRELRALLARTAAPVLARARRDALAAEVMARADALPARRASRWIAPGLAAAAAAVVAYAAAEPIEVFTVSGPSDGVAAGHRTPDSRTPDSRTPDSRTPDNRTPDNRTPDLADNRTPDNRTPDKRTPDATDPLSPTAAPDRRTPDAASREATVAGSNARFTRERANGRDVVDLRDGEITIDARSTAPVEIALGGGTGVRVAQAKVSVIARRGVIQSVTVFAGSAQLTTSGRQQRIEAGTMWHRETLADPGPGPIGPAPQPPVLDARDSTAAFREGWEALREARYSDAIAAFDRASDPVVAEDAAYWAAIAAERAGDRDAAIRRLIEFLVAFPASPRADAARTALAKLAR